MPTYRPRQQETSTGTGKRPQVPTVPQVSPWGLQTNPLAQMQEIMGLGNIWGAQQVNAPNPLLGQVNPMAALLGLGPQVGQMKPPEPPGKEPEPEIMTAPGKPQAKAKPKIENPLAGLGLAALLT